MDENVQSAIIAAPIVGAATGAMICYLKPMLHKEMAKPPERKQWRVVVVQASKGSFYDMDRNGVPVADQVAVRLVRRKDEKLTVGTVDITSPDFESMVQHFIVKGEEKAQTLNAYMDEYA